MGVQPTPREQAILATTFKQTGAVVMGRRLFDIVDGPHGWSDEVGYGARQDQSAAAPVFVLTDEAREEGSGSAWPFPSVTDGPASAIRQAKAAADGKDVVIMGGGARVTSSRQAGLADVMTIDVAPLILGGGTLALPGDATVRLELLESEMTASAQHLTYRVLAGTLRTEISALEVTKISTSTERHPGETSILYMSMSLTGLSVVTVRPGVGVPEGAN